MPQPRYRLWQRLDSIAHLLYTPTMAGRRCVRTRWHHHIHLIPTAVFVWICDRWENILTDAPDLE